MAAKYSVRREPSGPVTHPRPAGARQERQVKVFPRLDRGARAGSLRPAQEKESPTIEQGPEIARIHDK